MRQASGIRRVDMPLASPRPVRLLFVDDSGNPRGKRAGGDVGLYILAGVAVDDRDLPSVAKAAVEAKAAAGAAAGLAEWEAHAYDIWNNTGQFRGKGGVLTMRQKQGIFSGMIDVVASSQLGLIPVAVDRLRHGRQGTGRWPLAAAWYAMFRRFERMLDRPGGEYGLILADAGRAGDEKAARAIVEKMTSTRMERSPNSAGVLNGVIYRDSRLDIMIQLADMVAYVVHKHHREDARFQGWFEAIRPKFDAYPNTTAGLSAGDGYA